MLKIRVDVYETVSELLDDVLLQEGCVDILETPIRMGIDGDFYPSTFGNATHLLRIALSSDGGEAIQQTHDMAWCISDYGDDGAIAEGISEDGWLLLTTRRPVENGDWVAFVPNNVPDTKAFWAHAPNDPYTVWFSRAVELKPYLKEPVLPPIQ